jgi:hypothetical protein
MKPSREVLLPWLEEPLLHSNYCANDGSLHVSASSFLLTAYLAEGASTSVESPVVITCLCVFWQDSVEDFRVELPGGVQYPGHPRQNPYRDLHCDAPVDGPSTSGHLTCTHRLVTLYNFQ